jgi:hypothetical protein
VLPEDWRSYRPRRLRFLLFHCPGRLVQRGRRLLLRIARAHPGSEAFLRARQRLLAGVT